VSGQPPIRHFAIVTYRKSGPLRFLSHLDMARAIDRAVRRAGLPVKYSEGYNPSAQIGYTNALPVGTAGERELCQIELERPLDADEVHRALAAELPEDLGVVGIEVVSGQRRKHVSGHTRADYEIELRPDKDATFADLCEAVGELLEAGSIEVVRETKSQVKEVDIRPGLHELNVFEPRSADAGPRLRMSLALQQESLVKPSEVLEAVQRRLSRGKGGDVTLEVRVVTRLGLSA
jgi:radical SAM-linked protein